MKYTGNWLTGKLAYGPTGKRASVKGLTQNKKRRAITIKEGTKIVINPSIPLFEVYVNLYHTI
jgi:hypothetical protein